MEPVIKIENVGKKYRLSHHTKDKYLTLRDMISDGLKAFMRKGKGKSNNFSEEFWALKGVSFEIQKGDRIGIIGRNGAGKSTLLKILSRITEPTTGKITINGNLASLLEVGTGFHPELSGRENIFLNGAILGMGKAEIESKFDEIVAFAEIEKFLDTPVKRYSSGMYVRLAFSIAAHLEPDILIIDEVLAVGDAAFQKKCLGKIEEVSGRGRTVIFVSHNMEAIQKICTKVVLLQRGNLISFGNTDDVIEKYLNANSDTKSVFEVPPPDDTGKIPGYLTKVQIEDLNNVPINEIPIGRPWQARIFFKLTRETGHFILGVGLTTQFDLPINTSWTAPEDMGKGEYEAVFVNESIMITKGTYNMVIGLSENKVTFQYLNNLVQLHISDISDLAKEERIVNTDSGLIINQMKYKIVRK